MAEIARYEPYPLPLLAAREQAGLLWVTADHVRGGAVERILGHGELTPGLQAIRHHEAELGLDRWPRVCMRRDLQAPAPPKGRAQLGRVCL